MVNDYEFDNNVNCDDDSASTNRILATCTSYCLLPGHVLLWNIDKHIIINEHGEHGSTVHTVAFSPGT